MPEIALSLGFRFSYPHIREALSDVIDHQK